MTKYNNLYVYISTLYMVHSTLIIIMMIFKLAGVYEDVEEQRQIVAQWKRKVNKLNSESNDLKLMLEESNSRNNLLEKKQKK